MTKVDRTYLNDLENGILNLQLWILKVESMMAAKSNKTFTRKHIKWAKDNELLIFRTLKEEEDRAQIDRMQRKQFGLWSDVFSSLDKCGERVLLCLLSKTVIGYQAFEAGASGYLLKRSAASELTKAIQAVTSGQTYLTPLLRPEDLPPLGNGVKKQVPKLKQLTPRQREILQLIGEGKSTKEIATLLSISVKTVEFHKSNIMETLAIHTTAQLTRYAVAHDLAKL